MSICVMSVDGPLPSEKMEVMQDFIDESANQWNSEIDSLMKEFNLSREGASDILYLRSRSRWSPELEQELISIYQRGESVKICEWP